MTDSIKLNWQMDSSTNNQSAIISAALENNQRELVHLAIKNTVDKAVSLLKDNIKDNSRYFLCEWEPLINCLTIVVTDDSKTVDGYTAVKLTLSASPKDSEELTDDVRHWIHNYLTTHAGFMQFSLIAIFHSNSRNKTVLL